MAINHRRKKTGPFGGVLREKNLCDANLLKQYPFHEGDGVQEPGPGGVRAPPELVAEFAGSGGSTVAQPRTQGQQAQLHQEGLHRLHLHSQ
jgi:hypothetical protein